MYIKAQAIMRSQKMKQKDFSGGAPAPFVGHYGYPNVNVGILAPPDISDSWEYDAPKHWAAENYGVGDVVDLRSGLVNSRFSAHIKHFDRELDIAREVAMASKPVDVDISLKNTPIMRMSLDSHAAPTGPNAKLQKIDVTSNAKIPTRVQRAFDDTDLLSTPAMTDLFDRGYDENYLSRMLSVGTFGLEQNRKLVPTRWSITATDDMLGKHVLEEVKEQQIGDYQAYFGSYLGNYYLMLFFPDPFSYELFEMSVRAGRQGNWEGKGNWSTDYETVQGRKNYATETAGGYYTVRLAISEKMLENKRQGSCLALRFITDEYTLPLGVWVTREAARNSLKSKPLKFADMSLMLTYAKNLVKKKLGYNLDKLLPESLLLRERKQQLKLNQFA